jgi:uncharacterized protein with FMN-binding domain
MSKSSLHAFAAALAILGGAILTGHPPWGAVTGISILLTAGALAAGALAGKSPEEKAAAAQKPPSQKIPASIVTLSASAILAVYVAGYQRTRTAADQFEAQSARRQSVPPAAAVATQPKPTEPTAMISSAAPATASPQRAAKVTKPPATTSTEAAPRSQTQTAVAPATPTTAMQPTTATAPAPEPAAGPAPAPAIVPAAAVAASAPASSPSYKDGTFTGWGQCRHGSIQASVSIEGGQIVASDITQCRTRYSCSWIANLPGQVISRQSAKVDYVSGATESTDAFYDAISNALASARE